MVSQERPHSTGVESTIHTSSVHSAVSTASARLVCRMSPAAVRRRLW